MSFESDIYMPKASDYLLHIYNVVDGGYMNEYAKFMLLLLMLAALILRSITKVGTILIWWHHNIIKFPVKTMKNGKPIVGNEIDR